MSEAWVDDYLEQTLAATQAFCASRALRSTMDDMAERIVTALRAGNKLLIAGNGGSAGDAQHIAGEFVCRLMFDRAPLAAIALTTDSSVLTAISNDYDYDQVFERQIRALGKSGDVFLGISTSGRSPNILAGFGAARRGGLVTLGLCGAEPADMANAADLLLAAPSSRTAIIQQIHGVAAHIICALVETAMFPDEAS